MAQLEAKKAEIKDENSMEGEEILELIRLQVEACNFKLTFESNDNSKMITQGDICINVLNARNLNGWLSKTDEFSISNVKFTANGKILECVVDDIYKVYFYLLSKQEMKNMPSWSKTNATIAGMCWL